MTQTTQVTFLADAALKNSALGKARQEGITLKALLTMAMHSYVTGKLNVGISANTDYDELFEDEEIVAATNKLGKLVKSMNI